MFRVGQVSCLVVVGRMIFVLGLGRLISQVSETRRDLLGLG